MINPSSIFIYLQHSVGYFELRSIGSIPNRKEKETFVAKSTVEKRNETGDLGLIFIYIYISIHMLDVGPPFQDTSGLNEGSAPRFAYHP